MDFDDPGTALFFAYLISLAWLETGSARCTTRAVPQATT